MNTSLLDLQNQFKFLGIEDTAQMIGVYRESTFRHVGDSNASNNNGRGRRNAHRYISFKSISLPPVGHFAFLMRSVMMRHSQKQEYAGTSTTLMSLPPKVSLLGLVSRKFVAPTFLNSFSTFLIDRECCHGGILSG